jgi:hypothetical protein
VKASRQRKDIANRKVENKATSSRASKDRAHRRVEK